MDQCPLNVWVQGIEETRQRLAWLSQRELEVQAVEFAVRELQRVLSHRQRWLRNTQLPVIPGTVMLRDQSDDPMWDVALDPHGYVIFFSFDDRATASLRDQALLLSIESYAVKPVNFIADEAGVARALAMMDDGPFDRGDPTDFVRAAAWMRKQGHGCQTLAEVYGSGGLHRYFLRADGSVLYGKAYGQRDAEAARHFGFLVQE